MQLEQRETDALRPYERNSRTHSERQIAQIAASITEFGWTNPILIDEADGIIAGHGRLSAARLLGLASVPVIALHGLTAAQKRALTIADNKLALNSGWDEATLAAEIEALAGDGFDLALLGFDERELAALLAADDPGRPQTPIPPDAMAKAWRMWAAELAEQVRRCAETGAARQGVSPGFALAKFLAALHGGEDYPRMTQAAFHPQLYGVAGDKHSILRGLELVASGEIDWHRLQFVCGGDMDAGRVLGSPLPFAGARIAADFPAELARTLIEEFAPGGRVCDPCHGWGGRLVGFLLSSAVHYAGSDPAPATHAGVCAMRDLFAPFAPAGKTIELACLPAEEWMPAAGGFDLILTSPPYFDVEKYEGGRQARLEFGSYADWRDGFYRTLIGRAFDWLRPGGTFALQVGSQAYPLADDGVALAQAAGFTIEPTRATLMLNNFQDTAAADGEVVLVLQRPAKARRKAAA